MNKKENIIWYITSVLVCAALCIMYVCSKRIAVEDIPVESEHTTVTVSETEQYIPDRALPDDMFVTEETDDEVLYEIVTAPPETTDRSSEVTTLQDTVLIITDNTMSVEVPIERATTQETATELPPAEVTEKTEKQVSTQDDLRLININTASREELMELPGIGEKTADAIIEYRSIAPFETTEEIMEVKGIGEKKYENMKEYITV